MRPVQPSVVAVQRHVMLSAVPSSGTVNSVIRITGIGDHDRPEWLIRISGMRTMPNLSQVIGRSDENGKELPIEGTPYRGRNAHYWPPPAQIRTCGFPASNVVHHI